MTNSLYLICAAVLQLSCAQMLSYVQRNTMPQAVETTAKYVTSVANAFSNPATPTNMPLATAAPVTSNHVATSANTVLVNPNPASAATIQNVANANYAANFNAGPANAYANSNIAANVATPVAGANVANVANPNLSNAALASLANVNGNMATFNLGTNGNTFTVMSGSPGAQGFGISVVADALEVGGTVAVNGQIPIFGTVAVNGNVPTDGAATVNYNCGGKQVVI